MKNTTGAIIKINNDMHNITTDGIVPEKKMADDIRQQVLSDQPEKRDLTDKEVIESYINDDKTKINAIYWAAQFNERFNGNWFSVDQVVKKTQFKNAHEATGILQVMCLVGVAHAEKKGDGKLKYKICITAEQKVLLLKKEKERMEQEKEQQLKQLALQYDMRIAALEKEIEKMTPKKVEEEVTAPAA